MRRAIVFLYSSKSLLDFIWYYLAHGQAYEWDALYLAYGKNKEGKYAVKISEYAKRMNLFSREYEYDLAFADRSEKELLLELCKMVWEKAIGKQLEYCKRLIENSGIRLEEYDLILGSYTDSLFSGAITALGSVYPVTLMEDGSADYVEMRKGISMKGIQQFGIKKELSGYALARLGYANITMQHVFSMTKNCDKYATNPSALKYTAYKNIYRLNDMSLVNKNEYKALIRKAFSFDLCIDETDAIFFSTPYTEWFGDEKIATEAIVKYINENYSGKNVLLKKHGRDMAEYHFSNNVNVVEVDSGIPGEVILNTVKAEKILFAWPSSILLSCYEIEQASVFYFSNMEKINYYSKERLVDTLETIGYPDLDIISL